MKINWSNALNSGFAGAAGYIVGTHGGWVDILSAVALGVGLIGLWLCFMHEPQSKSGKR